MGLELILDSSGERSEVKLIGDLDIYTSPGFSKQVLEEFQREEKDLVFDAERLDYIDSTGLGAFISVYKTVNEKEKSISIVAAKPNVKKIFKITELDKIFRIEGQDE